ncbi:MAG: UbiH/UbiF/VisC/COQ6 family ubiquinone biosynthesis hydroxylase [Gammaproteobacteria bacterium]|nr:UbiH/UbiF/VisC/COQ6 family ubiquinone biosynthesis hydroxylase [Gammaproteobacteria bacterium]
MQRDFDLVIVGAGAVGTALAAALRDSGLSIAILDAHEPSRFSLEADLDLRVFAISCGTQRILAALGVWQDMQAARISPYHEMYVWDALGGASIHFDCADVGEPVLGHIVENRLIQHVLWRQLEHAAGVTAICPAQPATLAFEAQGVTLTLQDGQRLRTRLLVAADGAESATRRLAGIETRGWSYGQQAMVAHVTTEKPHLHTAWQRFLPTGPIALLPLHDGRSSVVWSLDESRAVEINRLDDGGFCAAVTAASAAILGEVTGTTPRAGFPLRLQHARQYVRPRFALVGDAAHALHPLAGQGMNLGFLDAAALAEVIQDAQVRHRDIGDLGVLRRYERWRKGDNLIMSIALDGFKRLFGNELPALQLLRDTGLRAVDRFTPLKSAFMKRAMGLHGDLPALAR